MTAQQALMAAVARLRAAGIEDAPRDARLLLARAMDIAPDRLTLHLHDPMPPGADARLTLLLDRRAARQPMAQILGQRLFWGRSFRVTPDVLDPRPETECLVDLALQRPFASVLDLGTGSGCILLTLLLERSSATGLGVDISAPALAVARANGQDHAVTTAAFRQGSWFDAVPDRFDLIVSNPPYIAASEMARLQPEVREHEPHVALTPGGDGLDAYRAIAAGALAHLTPGGALLLEIGPTQAAAVCALLAAQGLGGLRVHPDLDGRDRVVEAVNSVANGGPKVG